MSCFCFFFFFNDTATTEIYTLSLHDALPIFVGMVQALLITRHMLFVGFSLTDDNFHRIAYDVRSALGAVAAEDRDRKSTRLNSSHANISYAVFCLKKKKMMKDTYTCVSSDNP